MPPSSPPSRPISPGARRASTEASISSDPRFKPILLYQIIQIDLPVEQSAGAMRDQLVYARAIEGRQLVERPLGPLHHDP